MGQAIGDGPEPSRQTPVFQIHLHASRAYSETMSLTSYRLTRRHWPTVSDDCRMAVEY